MKQFIRVSKAAVLTICACIAVAGMVRAQGTDMVINHFVSDAKTIEGHIVVADVEGRGGSVTMTFYDDDGNVAGSGKETIPSNGKINVSPEKYVRGSKMTGTVRIKADKRIAAQYWQFYKNEKDGWKNIAVPAIARPGYTKLVCQHFVADPGVESYIVIADGDGKGTTAYIEFYGDKGDLAGQNTVNIPANGKVSLRPLDYVGGKKMTGVAYIQTEGGRITGEYWQASSREKYQIAHMLQGSAPVLQDIVEEPLIRVMVNFAFDSDKIQKRSYADLNEVAKAMNDSKNKSARYEIGGYTDDKGKAEYNRGLSERRAKSVKDYLVKTGKVDAKRLLTVGYGPDNPIVPNDSEANRAVNRRVEFKKMK